MRDLVERIRMGRQKGDLRRRLKFYRKSNKEYDEILSMYEKNKKTMRSNGRWMAVGFVLAVATIGYNLYKAIDSLNYYEEARTKLKSELATTAKMQGNATEAQEKAIAAVENAIKVSKSAELDEDVIINTYLSELAELQEKKKAAETAIKNSKVYDAMGITLLDHALGDSKREDGFRDLAERHLKLVQEFVRVTDGKWPEVYREEYEKVKGELDL